MSMEPATNMLADGSHVNGTSHNNVTRWSLVDGANHFHVDIVIFRFNYVFSLLKVATIFSVRLREAVIAAKPISELVKTLEYTSHEI